MGFHAWVITGVLTTICVKSRQEISRDGVRSVPEIPRPLDGLIGSTELGVLMAWLAANIGVMAGLCVWGIHTTVETGGGHDGMEFRRNEAKDAVERIIEHSADEPKCPGETSHFER